MSNYTKENIELRCDLLGIDKSEDSLANALKQLSKNSVILWKFISIIRIFECVSKNNYDIIKYILIKILELHSTTENLKQTIDISFHDIYCVLITKTYEELWKLKLQCVNLYHFNK